LTFFSIPLIVGIALKATGLKAAGLKGLISRVPFAFGDFVSFF
jgi:hypothetical protein